jgi:hypothetical protein
MSSPQCIAITKQNTQCSNSASYGDYCGIHKNLIPEDLQNIMNSYANEEKYVKQITNTNPKARDKIIKEELENIDLDEIIKFKLARQLAMNYIQKEQKKIDPSILTGFFLQYLNAFTYDQLLNDYKDLEIYYGGYTRRFGLGVTLMIIATKSTADKIFFNDDELYKNLSLSLVNRLTKNTIPSYSLFENAKKLVVKNNPDIYETTSYIKFLSEFEKELNEILDEKENKSKN